MAAFYDSGLQLISKSENFGPLTFDRICKETWLEYNWLFFFHGTHSIFQTFQNVHAFFCSHLNPSYRALILQVMITSVSIKQHALCSSVVRSSVPALTNVLKNDKIIMCMRTCYNMS